LIAAGAARIINCLPCDFLRNELYNTQGDFMSEHAPQGVTLEDLWAVLMELRQQVQALQESHHAGLTAAAVVPETVVMDGKTAAREMNRIRKVVEDLPCYPGIYDVKGTLEEAARRTGDSAEAAGYRRMLDILPAIDAARERDRPESIKAWLKQREEDWADPWEVAEAAKRERLRRKAAETSEAVARTGASL
jgi:hypothetical protein